MNTETPWPDSKASFVKFTVKFVEAASGSGKTRVVNGLARNPSETRFVMSGGKVRLVSKLAVRKSPVRWVRPEGRVRLVRWFPPTSSVCK